MRPAVERCKGRLPGSSEIDSRHQGPEERYRRRYQSSAEPPSGQWLAIAAKMSSLAARRAGPTAASTPATDARTTITASWPGGTTSGIDRSPSMALMIPHAPATARAKPGKVGALDAGGAGNRQR